MNRLFAETASFQSRDELITVFVNSANNIETGLVTSFNRPTLTELNFKWLEKIQLIGLHLIPELVQPGQVLDVGLVWRVMQRVPDWDNKVIVEVYSREGVLVSRSEFLISDLISWRIEGVEVSSRMHLYISPELPPGPYVLQLKMQSGSNIIPATGDDNREISELTLGIFYVAVGDTDPRQPPVTVKARLGGRFELLGYAPPVPLAKNRFRGKLFWRAQQKVPGDFIPVVYLVDEQDNIISRWEAAPLGGLYPSIQPQVGILAR